jgi:hypothetical protein
MKRYDLYRLVCEQSIPGGNPGGGGGGGQGGGKRRPGDLRLVGDLPKIKISNTPEIGTDERRPVSPKNFVNFLQGLPTEVIMQIEVKLEANDIEGAIAILAENGALTEVEIDILEQHLTEYEPNWADSPEGPFAQAGGLLVAIYVLKILNRSENDFVFFTGQVLQEAFMEYAFSQGIMNTPEDMFGDPDANLDVMEQFLEDWVNTTNISEAAADSIYEYFIALANGEPGAELPLPDWNDVFSFLSFQNFSTLSQPIMVASLLAKDRDPRNIQGWSWWMGKNSVDLVPENMLFGKGIKGIGDYVKRNWSKLLSRTRLTRGLLAVGGSGFGLSVRGLALTFTLELLVFPLVAAAGEVTMELFKIHVESVINSNPLWWRWMVQHGFVRPSGYAYGNPENGVVTNEFEFDYAFYQLIEGIPVGTGIGTVTTLGDVLGFITWDVPEYIMDIWDDITGGDPNWEPPIVDPNPPGYPYSYSPSQPTRQP